MPTKNPFDLLRDLADLLAGEADPNQAIEPVLEFIKSALGVNRICAVVLSAAGDPKIFCRKSDLCGECGEAAPIMNFVRRIIVLKHGVMVGDELLNLMTEEEKVRFRARYPLLLTVQFKGKMMGALWCDADFGESALARAKELLELMSPFIKVAFRNVYFYETQRGQEATLKRILDNLDASIYVSDLYKDDILFVNKKMSEEFGLTEDVSGQKCWKVFQDGFTERCSFCPSYELAKNPEQSLVWEEHNTATHKYYKNTDSVIKWLNGESVHLQHSVDITAEKKIMGNLETARRQAELASRAKGDFLSRMSHEIRTPINAIIGMSRIASESGDIEKAHDCIKKIDSSSKQLLGLINDILDMAKIEAGKMELARERFDFEKMLIDVANVISVRADEKGIKLRVTMDLNMPRFFMGDDMRMSQVITNLFSNAIKFTPPSGIVSLYAYEKEARDAMSLIEVSVSDTGVGISKDNQARLFKAFEQAESDTARKFGGTGLGLAISKSIVELMGGEVSLESEKGRGSVFTFTTPLERAEAAPTVSESFRGLDLSGLTILYLDADAESGAYFQRIMDSFKIPALVSTNRDDCLRKLVEIGAKGGARRFVFADWESLGEDAFEFCEGLRKVFGAEIIVMMPIARWSELQKQLERFGVVKHLSKPLFPSNVLNIINEMTGLAPVNKVDVAGAAALDLSPFHILLAEDVEINREIVHQALARTRAAVIDAVDGRVALDMVEADPEAYDLILMDVNMPEMDGYEATRKIRALPGAWAWKMPILAMTANAFAEDVRKSLDAGMDDHIPKPMSFEELLMKLEHYLLKRPRRPKPAGLTSAAPVPKATPIFAPAPAEASAPKDAPGELPPFESLVDLPEAMARLGDDVELYRTLLEKFLERDDFAELATQFASGDLEGARQTAHRVKGMSGNLSFKALAHDWGDLERTLKEGRSDSALLEKSRDVYVKTRAVLAAWLEAEK